MKNEIGPNWFGMLTIDNIEQVVKVIEEILVGKKYTFAAVNMYGADSRPGYLISEPSVRTSQELKPGTDGKSISFWYSEDRKYAGFNVSDSYGVWGTSTTATTPDYNPEFNNPYIVFEWHTIRITHRAPAGHLLYWIITVERGKE